MREFLWRTVVTLSIYAYEQYLRSCPILDTSNKRQTPEDPSASAVRMQEAVTDALTTGYHGAQRSPVDPREWCRKTSWVKKAGIWTVETNVTTHTGDQRLLQSRTRDISFWKTSALTEKITARDNMQEVKRLRQWSYVWGFRTPLLKNFVSLPLRIRSVFHFLSFRIHRVQILLTMFTQGLFFRKPP